MKRIKYNGKKFTELCLNGVDWHEKVLSNGQVILVSYSLDHPSMDEKYYCEV